MPRSTWQEKMRHCLAPDELIRVFEPSEIPIVVAGGETQGTWKMISGSRRATVSIDTWR